MTISIDLTGRAVVVTGATGGIGGAIAGRLAEAGASVIVHTRSRIDEARQLAASIGGVAVAADLVDPAGPRQLIGEAVERFGRLDGLVNNAAVQPMAPLDAVSDSDWSEMLATNLSAAHRLSQVAVAAMVDGGWITHIASIEGSRPATGHGHYAVSKAGLIMHARAAALEWGANGIRVNAVSPGLIDRPGLEQDWPDGVERWRAAAPLQRLGTPEDVADACLFLASDLARWVTGINLTVDGGFSTHSSW